MNISKIIYEFMIDHHSYTHNLGSCELKPEKKIQV